MINISDTKVTIYFIGWTQVRRSRQDKWDFCGFFFIFGVQQKWIWVGTCPFTGAGDGNRPISASRSRPTGKWAGAPWDRNPTASSRQRGALYHPPPSLWSPSGHHLVGQPIFFLFDPTQKKRSVVGENPSRAQKEKKNTTQNKTYEMNQMTRQLGWPARNRWGKTVLGASAGSKVANGLGSLGRCCCWPRRAKKKWAETAPKLERQENDWRHITLRPIGPARIHPSSLLIATVYFFFTDPPSLPTPVHVQIAIFQFLSTSTALGVPARDLTTFSSFN